MMFGAGKPGAELAGEIGGLFRAPIGWSSLEELTVRAAGVVQFEYLSAWQALLLFAVLALPVLLLGWKSLAALGPVRRWVALGARLAVLALVVLTLSGLRLERENRVVEVMVLRDISDSAQLAVARGTSVQQQVSTWLQQSLTTPGARRGDDRLGLVSFDGEAYVDLIPSDRVAALLGHTSAVGRRVPGTDPAAGINLALGSFSPDARRRIVLIWDGNRTTGDLEAAIEAARAQNVPIDVMPLEFRIDEEVYIERFVSPTWRREGEPFTLEVILNNVGNQPVAGTLRIEQEGQPLDLDPATPGVQSDRPLVLEPGRNRELITVDPIDGVDVRRFRAIFEPEQADGRAVGDTLVANNTANAFTFIRGRGRVLYIDNTQDGGGQMLRDALEAEGITTDPLRPDVDRFPTSLVELQGYDAVILNNVPRGAGGLTEPQQRQLAQYVHDTGGGLVMIGGPDSFGAGGWQGSDLEQVLPVNMDVPARRQIPKGALVLVMHPTEMPQGTYWGVQCALKAAEVLNREDDIGVLSYNWSRGRTMWDYPLSRKGDGARVFGAIRNMNMGDMKDFNQMLELALWGDEQGQGLIDNDARQKHIIIISDGDPSGPTERIYDALARHEITVSTVQVAGHGMPLTPVMRDLAERTGGRSYGPIEQDVSQLPQIFIKEATIVRRTLIQEDEAGFPIGQTLDAAGTELMRGMTGLPPVYGYVLTSRKDNPLVEVPLVVGPEQDPLFAIWTSGLGRSAAWMTDAHNRWAAGFAGSEQYDKFWAQLVRGVSRAPMSPDFDVRTVVEAGRGRIVVEAIGDDARFRTAMTMAGTVLGPDGTAEQVQLVQTRPGVYEASFDARREGPYVAAMLAADPEGTSVALRGGTAVNAADQGTFLSSDLAAVRRVAEATGGRILSPFGVGPEADLFVRDGLARSFSPLPVWDWLIPLLLGLIILDVAIRRIAWDWQATKATVAERVQRFTATVREDRDAATLGSLRQTRQAVQRGERHPTTPTTPTTHAATAAAAGDGRPDRTRKFEADGQAPAGDVSELVGGATNQPIPRDRPGKATPKGQQLDRPEKGEGLTSLMEAKRRARENIERQRGE